MMERGEGRLHTREGLLVCCEKRAREDADAAHEELRQNPPDHDVHHKPPRDPLASRFGTSDEVKEKRRRSRKRKERTWPRRGAFRGRQQQPSSAMGFAFPLRTPCHSGHRGLNFLSFIAHQIFPNTLSSPSATFLKPPNPTNTPVPFRRTRRPWSNTLTGLSSWTASMMDHDASEWRLFVSFCLEEGWLARGAPGQARSSGKTVRWSRTRRSPGLLRATGLRGSVLRM